MGLTDIRIRQIQSSGVQLMTTSYTVTSGASGRPEAREVVVTANTVNGANLTVSSTFGLNPGMRLTFSSNGSIDTSGSYWIVASGGSTVTGSSIRICRWIESDSIEYQH
jgi:hypothetical protein